MTTAKIIGQTEDGKYKINVKPENAPKDSLGSGGMVVTAENKKQAIAMISFYNSLKEQTINLENSPKADQFIKSEAQLGNTAIEMRAMKMPTSAKKVPREVQKGVEKIRHQLEQKTKHKKKAD